MCRVVVTLRWDVAAVTGEVTKDRQEPPWSDCTECGPHSGRLCSRNCSGAGNQKEVAGAKVTLRGGCAARLQWRRQGFRRALALWQVTCAVHAARFIAQSREVGGRWAQNGELATEGSVPLEKCTRLSASGCTLYRGVCMMSGHALCTFLARIPLVPPMASSSAALGFGSNESS